MVRLEYAAVLAWSVYMMDDVNGRDVTGSP